VTDRRRVRDVPVSPPPPTLVRPVPSSHDAHVREKAGRRARVLAMSRQMSEIYLAGRPG
jgi:hypothetical protein